MPSSSAPLSRQSPHAGGMASGPIGAGGESPRSPPAHPPDSTLTTTLSTPTAAEARRAAGNRALTPQPPLPLPSHAHVHVGAASSRIAAMQGSYAVPGSGGEGTGSTACTAEAEAEASFQLQHCAALVLSDEMGRAQRCTDALMRLIRNVLSNPGEPKYRTVRLSNPRIQVCGGPRHPALPHVRDK